MLWNVVHALATLAVFNLNGGHPGAFALNSTLQSNVEVKYVTNNDEHWPPGLQPAFALKDGCLVLASAPGVVQAFSAAQSTPPMARDADVPLVRVSIREVVRFLKDRQEVLVPYIAKKNQLTNEVVAGSLDGLLTGLELFDAIEVSQRCDPGRVILSLRVRPSQPLK